MWSTPRSYALEYGGRAGECTEVGHSNYIYTRAGKSAGNGRLSGGTREARIELQRAPERSIAGTSASFREGMAPLSAEGRAALAGFFRQTFAGLQLHKELIQDKLVALVPCGQGGGVGGLVR